MSYYYNIALVGCSKQKQTGWHPARELYSSPLFRAAARYAATGPFSHWFILSAQYGLVHPDDWIASYDLSLTDMPRVIRQSWASRVAWGLMPFATPTQRPTLTLLAGRTYCRELDEALAGRKQRKETMNLLFDDARDVDEWAMTAGAAHPALGRAALWLLAGLVGLLTLGGWAVGVIIAAAWGWGVVLRRSETATVAARADCAGLAEVLAADTQVVRLSDDELLAGCEEAFALSLSGAAHAHYDELIRRLLGRSVIPASHHTVVFSDFDQTGAECRHESVELTNVYGVPVLFFAESNTGHAVCLTPQSALRLHTATSAFLAATAPQGEVK